MAAKYKMLYERLRDEIDNGIYAPGEKLPTEEKMTEWGFSRNTVRQALALLQSEGRILKRRGSSSMVKPLRSSSNGTGNIAVMMQDFSQTVFPELISGINDGMSGWGTPLLYASGAKIEAEGRILEELKTKDIEGILVNGLYTALPNINLDKYQYFIDEGVPVIFMLSYYKGLRGSYFVINDDVAGGAMAAQRLYEQGRRKLCGIFTSDFTLGQERYEGFVTECRQLDIEVSSEQILWIHSKDFQRRDALADRVLMLIKDCDGLVCNNDYIAREVLTILIDAGKKIPQEIALLSFDNTYLCDYPPISLSSFYGNAFEIGKLAAQKLKNVLSGRHEESEKLPWVLVERESG